MLNTTKATLTHSLLIQLKNVSYFIPPYVWTWCDDYMLQEAAREREIEERERKLGALMAEKGASGQKKKSSKVCALLCQVMLSHA